MSLISQNARSRNETKREEDVKAKEVEDGQDYDVDTVEVKKRKLDGKEEHLAKERVKEMKKLESFLFGSLYSPLEFGNGDDDEGEAMTAAKASNLFFTDRSADSGLTVYQEDSDFSDGSCGDDALRKKPVWVDEEEEKVTVNIAKVNRLRKLRKEEDENVISGSEYVSRLRAQHVKLNQGTDWAQLDSGSKMDGSSDDELTDDGNNVVVSRGYEDLDDILRTNEDLVVKSSSKLLPGHIEYSKLVDANIQDPSNGPINSAKVGSRLIELLVQTAYIQPPSEPESDQSQDGGPDIRPAFVHSFRTMKEAAKTGRKYGVIECDPLILKGLDRTAKSMAIPYMPMVVPPVNWTGFDKGGYLFLPSYVMRTHGVKQQREAVKKVPRKQLEPVFEALDTLGNTKWRVNNKVLSVVDRIWAGGGRLAGLVDRNDVEIPEELESDDEAEKKKWKWKVKSVKKENRERYSLRCDTELKLAVARKMKDEECFYYPHNLDFRGRAYPMHPHLNHLGSDVCRGILEFADGRPLGKSGLHWLKIHLANLYGGGVDKLSNEGRITFVENHLDEIFDSAEQPMEGRRWWLNAEDPFQFLAACMTLTEALKISTPESFISHIPVHQDGSCNGLQHYAALGRDKLGAAAVNLVAGEKPADVYSGIAARVLAIMKIDAQKDPETFSEARHAKILVNQVDRKLVKQTVMTSVYGVTYIGAREQIKRRLKERDAIADDSELFGAACYAAKVTLTALQEMFEGARSIMNWLGDCAKVIASENEPVCWTTPLGLPVVQPYRYQGRHIVKTSLQMLTLKRETDKVMVKRQRTAFPPNFVHSLDGSHMMMTAIACKKAGLSFAGVHDSYWTHACDVDNMNRILREKFVELYETPILENLLESFQESFPSLEFPPLPERGNLDLNEVLESPYFFN